MVGGHDEVFTALLVQPEERAQALGVVVLNPHGQGRAHPRKGIRHKTDQRPVPEPYQGRGINAVQ